MTVRFPVWECHGITHKTQGGLEEEFARKWGATKRVVWYWVWDQARGVDERFQWSWELFAQKSPYSHFEHANGFCAGIVAPFAKLARCKFDEKSLRTSDIEAEIRVIHKWFLIHSGNFSEEESKEFSGVTYIFDYAFLLNAHLNCHLVPNIHYENLVLDAVRRVLLATESCMQPALIWPWPGTAWLIPSWLEFYLFWVLA